MAYIYDLTDTWNAGGTTFNAIKMNVTDSASAAGSKLVTLQTNGTEHFSVTKAGAGYFSGNVGIGTAPAANIRVYVRTAAITDTAYYADNGFNSGFTVKFASSLTSIGNDFGSPLAFLTNNSERMRIDASGNVGIGTSSPIRKFSVQSGDLVISEFVNTTTSAYLDIADGIPNTMRLGSFGGVIGIAETNTTVPTMSFVGGKVGIGTSSPGAKLHVDNGTSACQLRIRGGFAGSTSPELQFYAASSDHNWTIRGNHSEALQFGKGVYGDFGSELMRLDINGNLGVGTSSPQLKLVVSNSGAAGLEISPDALASSPLIQSYNRSGAAYTQLGYNALQHVWQTSGTERARIDSSGNLLVGKTTATITDQGAEIKANGQINSALPTGSDFWNAYSTSAAAYRFYVTNGGTIYATSTSITAISDQRLKENVRDLDAGLDAVLALKPRRFDWKDGKGKDIKDDMGFIAQEVENVLPELVGGWKAGDGEPDDLKSVKAGDLIPVLVKAIQELTARVAQLEGN